MEDAETTRPTEFDGGIPFASGSLPAEEGGHFKAFSEHPAHSAGTRSRR